MVEKKILGEGFDKELQFDINNLKTQIEQEIAQIDDSSIKIDLKGLLTELQAVKDREELGSFVVKLDSMKILEKKQVSEKFKGAFAQLGKSVQTGQKNLNDLSQEELQAMADRGRQTAANRVVEQDVVGAKKMFGKKGWIANILDKASF